MEKFTCVKIYKAVVDEIEVTEVKIFVEGERKAVTKNLLDVIAKENELAERLGVKKFREDDSYERVLPKDYYKSLAKEVGKENLLYALKELRKLSKKLPDLGVNRFQELKLALSK